MRTAGTRPRAVVAAAATPVLVAAGAFAPAAAPAAVPVAAATPVVGRKVLGHATSPLSIEQCEARWKIACYDPSQYRVAYDLNPLYRAGITGQGRTIVIIDSYGSPTVQHDLDVYSGRFGIPSTRIGIVRWGDVPKWNPKNATMTGWAGETTLDVEMAHAIAPGARIVLVETGVAETSGVTGFPQMMSAERHLIDQGVGDVVSQSFGTAENTFPGFGRGDFSSVEKLRYAFRDAAAHNVTVLASSGDGGATDDTADGAHFYPYRVNSWPSSDPLVVSVGGTQLHLNDQGRRVRPDSVYHDSGASGGGQSHVFARPAFQDGVRGVVGARRGTPDVAMAAAVNGGAWTYASYDPAATGWSVAGGTSEASPLFAGIIALADQLAGHRLGDIHDALYRLERLSGQHVNTGIVDVADGTNNSYQGVTGYTAVKGYDMATGVGTVDAARFVPALVAASARSS